MDSQIPYFCGDSEECLILGSRKALEQAKRNIEANFVMVGILEDLSMTHAVLECLLPDQFQGLSQQHEQHHLHVHSHHKDPEAIRKVINFLSIYLQISEHFQSLVLNLDLKLYHYFQC